jgi:hypothetical protein
VLADDRRGVPQDVGHVFEAGTPAQEFSRKGVAESVGMRTLNFRFLEHCRQRARDSGDGQQKFPRTRSWIVGNPEVILRELQADFRSIPLFVPLATVVVARNRPCRRLATTPFPAAVPN